MTTPELLFPQEPLTVDAISRLLTAIDAYDAGGNCYDDVFREVGEAFRADGSAGKTMLAALLTWKRARDGVWVKRLLATPEEQVRAATRAAFEAAGDDYGALRALSVLPGMRSEGPIATVVLSAFDPGRWSVMDVRARKALAQLDRPVAAGETVRYQVVVRQVRDELVPLRPGITARDVDKGLWVLGEQPRSGRGLRVGLPVIGG